MKLQNPGLDARARIGRRARVSAPRSCKTITLNGALSQVLHAIIDMLLPHSKVVLRSELEVQVEVLACWLKSNSRMKLRHPSTRAKGLQNNTTG